MMGPIGIAITAIGAVFGVYSYKKADTKECKITLDHFFQDPRKGKIANAEYVIRQVDNKDYRKSYTEIAHWAVHPDIPISEEMIMALATYEARHPYVGRIRRLFAYNEFMPKYSVYKRDFNGCPYVNASPAEWSLMPNGQWK